MARPSGETAQVDTGEFARCLAEAQSPLEQLDVGLRVIADVVICDHAAISLSSKGGLVTVAATDQVGAISDAWQRQLGEGPSWARARGREIATSADLGTERRWPVWSARLVHELGVGSMMSLPLYTNQRSFGALTLYGDNTNAFGRGELLAAMTLGAHLAVAMAARQEIEQLRTALTTRTVIGQAEGILMTTYGLDTESAFGYLRRMSQTANRKLSDVAAEVVRRRHILGLDRLGLWQTAHELDVDCARVSSIDARSAKDPMTGIAVVTG